MDSNRNLTGELFRRKAGAILTLQELGGIDRFYAGNLTGAICLVCGGEQTAPLCRAGHSVFDKSWTEKLYVYDKETVRANTYAFFKTRGIEINEESNPVVLKLKIVQQ